MPEATINENISPPRLIPSLVEGFNAIASRVFIILFPIGIDLLFWFGPLVRIKEMLLPVFNNAAEISGPSLGEDGRLILEASLELWEPLLERLNLLFSLRTIPVGIPSLLANQGSLKNPLGSPTIIEISSLQNTLGIIFLMAAGGIILGSIYYEMITCAVTRNSRSIRFADLGPALGQTAILTGIMFLAAIILGVPLMCVLSTIAFLLPSLGTLPFTVAVFILIWVLLPLVFSGHGIFYGKMKATQSIATSVTLVRRLMTPVGIFLISIILLAYGLNMLWSTPPTESWMLIVGIFGHGFVSSGLLAATFVFYRDGLNWFKERKREMEDTTQSLPS